MIFRLLDISDIHPRINGTYAGKLILDPSTGYSVGFTDMQRSLKACLDWELEDPCDLAVIPGDVFNVARPSPSEYALISEFLLSLLGRMSVVMIAGNHDQDVNSHGTTALEPLRSLARAFNRDAVPHQLHVMTQPGMVLIQTAKGKVCVSGLPYPSKGQFQAAAGGVGDGPEVVMGKMNSALRDLVRGMNARLSSEYLNVMLAHGTVSGATVGEQPRSIAHDLMIPLDEMGDYDVVCLGHIHKFQKVGENAFYAGSLLAQSFGEKDEPKGWCVVEVERGQNPVIEHIDNPHSRDFFDIYIGDLSSDLVHFPVNDIYRIVGHVAEADWAEASLAIAKFEQTHPFVLSNIKTVQLDARARDATMTTLLTADEAVEKVVRTIAPDESVPAVMMRHGEIQGGHV